MSKIEVQMSVTAYIGLGSNQENPVGQLRSARLEIQALPSVLETAFSSLYRSAPMGPSDQPDYVNAVMAVATTLSALDLLKALQAIELSHGRVRTGERWGPRTLDLDLLLYGQEEIVGEILTVPHPGIAEREFVLYPLAEIAPPGLVIPSKGALAELVQTCPRRGLTVIDHA
jgi:2-amino-4-hydroxy-6-hydroxymethyldihydropteridine diphosphokinase